MQLKGLFLLLVLLSSHLVLAQEYEHKTALVIGNTNYEIGKLKNPGNDARALSATLSNLGFKVTTRYDLDREGLRATIREFGQELKKREGVAFFYYAGHGIQSEGVNYLVPVDADIQEEYDIVDQCVSADQVLRLLKLVKSPFNIIVLDACRNNPYENRYRSGSRGLAQPQVAPTGSIMAYATAPGKTASDGEGLNGLYTQELIKAINTPGLGIEAVFKQTRIHVKKFSDDRQIPWENSSLIGDFYFLDKPDDKVTIGNITRMVGSVLLSSTLAGELLIDDKFFVDVPANSVIPIHNINAGPHRFKIRSTDRTWSKDVTILADSSIRLYVKKKEFAKPSTLIVSARDLYTENYFFRSRYYITSGTKEYFPEVRPNQPSPFSSRFIEILNDTTKEHAINDILIGYRNMEPGARKGVFGKHEAGGEFVLIPTEAPEGQLLKFLDLKFELGSDSLVEGSLGELDRLLEVMEFRSDLKIRLEGHTDYIGNPTANFNLSQERVDAIQVYLEAHGINKKRISTKAFGGSKPLIMAKKRKERAINRRVEIRIVDLHESSSFFYNQNRALLFTFDKYKEFPGLNNPTEDALTIANQLTNKYGFNVNIASNFSKEEIFRKIGEYSSLNFGEEDQLLVYFMGHGVYDAAGNRGYLVTKDSKMVDQTYTTYISQEFFLNSINNINSPRILVVIDATLSGLLDQEIK